MPSAPYGPLQTLADVARIEATPLSARLAAPDVFGCLKAAAIQHADRPAIIDMADPARPEAARWFSYADVLQRLYQTANMLHDAGGGRPAGYLLPNLAETHFVLWGAAASVGAAPVNPLLSAEIVEEILSAVGAGCLVTTAPGTPLYDTAVKAARALGSLDVITVGEGGDFEARCAAFSSDRFEFTPDPSVDAIAAYFHTGGTTGAPKLAQQTRANQAAMSWMLGYIMDLSPEDRVLTGLPLFHANAAILTGLAPLCAGASVLLAGPNGFRNKALLEHFWSIVDRFDVTAFSAVPTIYASLLDYPVGEADVSSLRFGFCGAAPMPVSVIEAFEARTGITLLEGYGMTESTCVSTANPRDGERRAGSIGFRLPYHEVKIAITDDAGAYVRDAQPGEVGVVALRGATVIPGYKQTERNAEAFFPEGWLNSGDLGRMDADGYVWLTGRAKDLIIRGGHNIDPGLIEEALNRHDAVELAAAIGQPDLYAGEVPVAYVKLREGAEVTEHALEAFAREHVAERPAAPKAVRIVQEMPVTAVGKIFKPALREDAAIHACRNALADQGLGEVRLTARTEAARGLVVTVSGLDDAHLTNAGRVLDGFSFQWERG